MRPLRLDHPRARASLVTNSALSMVGLLAQGLLRFTTSWLVGRLAGGLVLGTVQSAISAASMLALLGPTSTGTAASKYLARARGMEDPVELAAVATHLQRRVVVLASLLGVVGVLFWVLYDGGGWVGGLWVGLLTAAYSGYSFTRGVQFGTGQVPRATAWDVISAVAGIAALAVALALGARGSALILPLVLSYAAYTVASWPRVGPTRPRLAPALRREIDEVILLGVTGTVASAGFLQVAMITAKGADPDGAGQFAAAMATATPASLLAISLSLALFPSLSEAWARGDRTLFRFQTNQAARVLMVVMVTILGSLALCSRLVMGTLWGPDFDAASPIFPMLVMGVLFTTVAVPSVNALVTRSRRHMRVTTAASFTGLCSGVAVWWLAPNLTAEGVALGFLVGSVVSGEIPFLAEWRVGGHRWSMLALRPPLAAAMVATGLAALHWLDVSVWWEPVAAMVFCLIWWGLSWRDLALLPWDRLRRGRGHRAEQD